MGQGQGSDFQLGEIGETHGLEQTGIKGLVGPVAPDDTEVDADWMAQRTGAGRQIDQLDMAVLDQGRIGRDLGFGEQMFKTGTQRIGGLLDHRRTGPKGRNPLILVLR